MYSIVVIFSRIVLPEVFLAFSGLFDSSGLCYCYGLCGAVFTTAFEQVALHSYVPRDEYLFALRPMGGFRF